MEIYVIGKFLPIPIVVFSAIICPIADPIIGVSLIIINRIITPNTYIKFAFSNEFAINCFNFFTAF